MTTSYNKAKKQRHKSRIKDEFGNVTSTKRLFKLVSNVKKEGGDNTNGNEPIDQPTTESKVDNGLAEAFLKQRNIDRGSI